MPFDDESRSKDWRRLGRVLRNNCHDELPGSVLRKMFVILPMVAQHFGRVEQRQGWQSGVQLLKWSSDSCLL